MHMTSARSPSRCASKEATCRSSCSSVMVGPRGCLGGAGGRLSWGRHRKNVAAFRCSPVCGRAIRAATEWVRLLGDGVCAGDQGGPLVYRDTRLHPDPDFVTALVSSADISNGRCAGGYDLMRFTRLDAKIWMFDTILQWSRQRFCEYSQSTIIPGFVGWWRCR